MHLYNSLDYKYKKYLFSCSAVFETVIKLRVRGCAWERKALLICPFVNMWMGILHVFSLCFFSTGPQMTWAHAVPFRAAFILLCTSRGWNGAGLVSLHRSPCGPVKVHASVQSRDATTLIYYSEVILCLWIKRQLNYVVRETVAGPEQFRGDGLLEPRWEDERDGRRCLTILTALGDFLFLWSVLSADEKQRWGCRWQSRPLVFPVMSVKCPQVKGKIRAWTA